jgi:GTPase SAR1 family protein
MISFGANIDIRDMVRYKDVMKEYGLGPNGGILTSLKGDDFSIATKTVLHHHVLIPHSIVNVISPKRQCHHRMVKVNDEYMFRNKDFFTSRWFQWELE